MHEQSDQPVLSDARLFAVPDLEDETDVEATVNINNPGKPLETPTPDRPWSNLSMIASSFNRKTKTKTRSYKFIQLERGLISANLLKNNDDRVKFETEYLRALRDNTFDEFLQRYYQKIHDHYAQIKKERELKKARIFASFDLEKNFLALDPTRDVKILFVDESSDSTGVKTAYVEVRHSLPYQFHLLIVLEIFVRLHRYINEQHQRLQLAMPLSKLSMPNVRTYYSIIHHVHAMK